MLPPLTILQLQVFAAVAREGGFRRAADALLISESAVSEHVKHLERAVGVRLIQRASGRRSIDLTTAGQALLEATTDALRSLEGGIERAREAALGRAPTVKLAVSPTFGGYFLPEAYTDFTKRYPETPTLLSVGTRTEVLDGLTSRAVDLGIISEGADDPAFLAFPLCTFDMVLVGAPGHRLATPEAAPFAELAHERIITSGPQSAPRRAIEQLASVDGVRLNLVLQIEEADMVAQAVSSGLGIAVSSWPFISQRLLDGHLALLHVRGFPISSEWFLVHRRETLSAPVRVLRDYLLNFPWPNGQVPASQAAV